MCLRRGGAGSLVRSGPPPPPHTRICLPALPPALGGEASAPPGSPGAAHGRPPPCTAAPPARLPRAAHLGDSEPGLPAATHAAGSQRGGQPLPGQTEEQGEAGLALRLLLLLLLLVRAARAAATSRAHPPSAATRAGSLPPPPLPPHISTYPLQFLAAVPISADAATRAEARRWCVLPHAASRLRLHCLALWALLAVPACFQALEAGGLALGLLQQQQQQGCGGVQCLETAARAGG